MSAIRKVMLCLTMASGLACAQTLPDHDNRIFTAVPVAKLSASELASAFVTDRAAADRRFAGRAVEVSGTVRNFDPASPESAPILLQAGDADQWVRAALHPDRAVEIRKTLADGQRTTLRCFCEGLTDHVQLKSCVVP
jgi:hypothetical protein